MAIRPRWLRDICSVIFSAYYIAYANEADEKLRRFRAVPTVEMLRATWEKTTNPYLRLLSRTEHVALYRKILLPRPNSSPYKRPIHVYLYFHPLAEAAENTDPLAMLALQEDLILDFPGGGFVAMTPEHHEERLRSWANSSGRPVLSVDYGKAPEHPYPFAIDEAFDTYRILVESKGKAIGMSGKALNVIMTGDSAGATIIIGAVNKMIEHSIRVSDPSSTYRWPSSEPPQPLPMPVAMVFSYACLDFNFTSWMTPANLRVLREETEADESRAHGRTPSILRHSSSFFYQSDGEDDEREGWASGLRGAKDHLSHVSPLAVVGDERRKHKLRRKKSWVDTLKIGISKSTPTNGRQTRRKSTGQLKRGLGASDDESESEGADVEGDYNDLPEEDRPLQARVRYSSQTEPSSPILGRDFVAKDVRDPHPLDAAEQAKLEAAVVQADVEVESRRQQEGAQWKKEPIGTRLTMTSRTGYFQDRIVSPSMMRAMAILYIGPHLNPDFTTDYHISPILTPSQLLARYPPLLMQCGEKDPFVDDSIIFAGRVREAKRERKEELRKVASELCKAAKEHNAVDDELAQLESQSEDDWVRLQIFSEWSHGYLQMPMLMHEAAAVIRDISAWMEDMFVMANPPAEPDVDAEQPSLRSAVGYRRPSVFSRIWAWTTSEHEQEGAPRTPRMRISTPADTEGYTTALTTDTETENDEGITFVPKARREKGSFGSDATVNGRPLIKKPVDHTIAHGNGSTVPKANGNGNGSANGRPAGSPAEGERAANGGGLDQDEDERASRSRTRSPKSADTPGRGSGSKSAGQTISEQELMRRRRLLDSHIFVSEG
ncbi:hypothetical protein EWM64_g8640 [Hericium alpestre]|uniref:Alpha/beta hydrolase fold-3 domain-containing protein n=1 Tax=Hericium alpestre TaxID=135208 RepID=A0A4Y9ZMZ7_9AGAM|nr:hypothetical protein EWM64_g8640 [Hericium alpestre]